MKICSYIKIYGPPILEALERLDELAKKLPTISKGKISELPNGIPFNNIRNSIMNTKITRKSLGIKLDDFVIISVGLKALKGPQYLIEAVKELICEQKFNDRRIKVLLVGSGSYVKSLKQDISKAALSKYFIHFENISENKLNSLYALSDIAVLPILDISGPDLTVLEAMVAGLPVITTDSWGNPSVIKNDVNGYLVPIRDIPMLKEAILNAYNKDAKDLKEMGMKSLDVARDLSWDNIARRAIKIYNSIL